ncbi:MAG: MFS transporter [Gammaproteobacteria bacterium]
MRSDPKSKSSRKASFASFIGTTIEWYDFYLYGIASALIFNKLFFPTFDPITGVMASYATYAVGFFARPLGGIIFGHFGDRISRKYMLIITLMIMGTATFLIGCLPTYNQIGVFAPALLVLLRCLQGIGVGGEWGGAVVLSAEHSREKERGFYASWPNAGAPFGLLFSILVFLIFSYILPQDKFLSWGWRIPFLLGSIIVCVGLFVRMRITDSPLFEEQNKDNLSKIPAIELTISSTKNLILAMGARFAESSSYYLFTVFILSYATEYLHLTRYMILYGVMLASLIEIFTIPIFGHISDKVGRRPVYILGALLVGLYAFPFFWLVQTKEIKLIYFALILGLSISHAAMHGPQAAFLSEMFKTRVRYSGVAIAYHLSAALSGGLAPLIATAMVKWTGGQTWPVSIYIICMSLITMTSLYLARETFQKKI